MSKLESLDFVLLSSVISRSTMLTAGGSYSTSKGHRWQALEGGEGPLLPTFLAAVTQRTSRSGASPGQPLPASSQEHAARHIVEMSSIWGALDFSSVKITFSKNC